MKQAVFVDTSAWLALINESDADHAKARAVRDKLLQSKKRFVVTDYIIVEIDKGISEKAWQMYSDRTDKEWSLTDCASFIVMKKYVIRDAFTNDHHFEQAGFECLIK
jgi:uncharacterized protein